MSVPAPLLASFPNLPIGVALIGACFGSFLNLVAWRLPREESILLPPSHCPHCGSRLRWYENVPVLGWLWLRGRCGHCGAPIAIRYPLVELLSAGLWVACLQATPAAMGPRPLAWLVVLAGWLLLSWLLPLLLIDLDYLWLPEPLCRVGLLLGLGMTAIIGFQQGEAVGRALLFHHLLAAGVGDQGDALLTVNPVVVAAALADAGIGHQIFAIHHQAAFGALAPEPIALFHVLGDPHGGGIFLAIREPVEKRHAISRRRGPAAEPI